VCGREAPLIQGGVSHPTKKIVVCCRKSVPQLSFGTRFCLSVSVIKGGVCSPLLLLGGAQKERAVPPELFAAPKSGASQKGVPKWKFWEGDLKKARPNSKAIIAPGF